jgi:hypothetical protein
LGRSCRDAIAEDGYRGACRFSGRRNMFFSMSLDFGCNDSATRAVSVE